MIVDPSGETSSDIHVPSVVVNDTVRVVCSGSGAPAGAAPRRVAVESCAIPGVLMNVASARPVAATVAEHGRREGGDTVMREGGHGKGTAPAGGFFRYTTVVDQPRYLICALRAAQ